MRAFDYRMNRVTYGVAMAALVGPYIILVNTMKRPPGAEWLVAFIAVPRLHDIGRSGWWLLALFLGEIVPIAIGWNGGEQGILIAGGLYVMFCMIVLAALGFIPGNEDANRWGEPPRAGVNFSRPKPAESE